MKIISPIVEHFLATDKAKDFTSVQGEMQMLVELQVDNKQYQQPIYFPSQTMLDGENCTITGIELLDAVDLAFAPSGKEMLGLSTAKKGILNISNLDREIICQLPLVSLIRNLNNGKLKFTKFVSQVWQNCYVELAQIPITSPESVFIFIVYYTLNEKK